MIDGEADSFAMETYPDLKPKWLFELPEAEIDWIWAEKYRPKVLSTDLNYESYMFGNEEMGIPWCAGYAIGYMLVQRYLCRSNHTAAGIIEMKPELILEQLED